MVGASLHGIHTRLDTLADDGRFEVVCARTGRRPFPAADHRFPSRSVAEEAARLVGQYRAALRRYDPTLARLDLVVCESVRDGRDGPRRQATVEFCHDVAGATFEALSAAGHDAVERAVMDHYLAAAERVLDRDALCLALLDSMAAELDRRLTVEELAAVCRDAARRLPEPVRHGDPLDDSLTRFRSLSLLDGYDRSTDRGSCSVVLSGYALAEERVTTLPLVVDLSRRHDTLPRIANACALDEETWRLTVVFDGPPTGLATAG
ncbi:DUF7551 domain-containing protein [Halomarina oriensis]|uniref:Uncharacterized protein n=1 Tax=Halomarina oriensis TaxID=671145 RepID=A0A6B0GMR7_9EURY|nr:hypothetical protein [Halomarina oriensis]MWG34779.1 hypothetical protein [Halomarina oriensis]